MTSERELERIREEIGRDEKSRSILLWFSVLAGPIAWAVQMFVNYNIGESFLCAPAWQARGELIGLGIGWWITAVNVVLLALIALAGLVAMRCHLRLRRAPGADTVGVRARWMSTAGIVLSVSYFFIVLVGVAPPLFIDSCELPL